MAQDRSAPGDSRAGDRPLSANLDLIETSQAEGAQIKPEDVLEVLREVYDPEIPVNVVDLGLVYGIDIKPERIDVRMTLTALGCPLAGEFMTDVRDHLLALPGVKDA